MSILEIVKSCGLEIEPEGGDLRIRGLRKVERKMAAMILEMIREQKPALLQALSQPLEKEFCPQTGRQAVLQAIEKERPGPFIDEHGVLVIPFEAPERFHWWTGGQSIQETLRELKAPIEVVARYATGPGRT